MEKKNRQDLAIPKRIASIFSILSAALLLPLLGSCNNPSGGSAEHAATPSDLMFTEISVSDSEIEFTWRDIENPAVSDLRRTLAIGNSEFSTITSPDAVGCTFTGLEADGDYTLIFQALDESGSVLFSYSVTLTTAGSPGDAIDYRAINTPAQLNAIKDSTDNFDDDYMLMYDISIADYPGWTPIGDDNVEFSGTFNGAGHTIGDMTIDVSSNTINYGLFGWNGGNIVRLGLIDCRITAEECGYIGGLAARNTGRISECYSTGSISGARYVGGLVGMNDDENAVIENCYNTASVSIGGSTSLYYDAGGIAGFNEGKIRKCYSIGSVTAETNPGGIVGANNITGEITYCFSDSEASGLALPIGLDHGTVTSTEVLTTLQMKDSDNYSDWDFVGDWNGVEDIWDIDASGAVNGGYPYLTGNVPAE